MLAWALFSKDFDLCTVRERACVENVLMNLKLRFAVNAPEGYNPAVKAMLLTLEPIQYVHRPLAFYMSLTTVQVAGDAVLTLFGFSRHEINGSSTASRRASTSTCSWCTCWRPTARPCWWRCRTSPCA
jgi:hypothetical protein